MRASGGCRRVSVQLHRERDATLEADDAHGAKYDLITQHYAISRTDLLAVVQLVAQALGDRRSLPGALDTGCPQCGAALA
jgi:hypothetical protein